jgi:hypothetical protein
MANEKAGVFERRRAFSWFKAAAGILDRARPVRRDLCDAHRILRAADDQQTIFSMRLGKFREKTAPIIIAPMILDSFSAHIDCNKGPRAKRGDGSATRFPLLLG